MPENNQTNDNITKAFEPDYLNRKALAVEWTDALLSTRINHHLVISVSGDWGTGKTYLATNWHKYLEEQEYFTCYIDAHKKDYAEDPLLIIMSEIESYVNKHVKKENGAIKEAFEKVKDSFLPFLTSGFKTAVKVGAGILLPDIISSNILKIIDNIDGEKLKEIIKGSIDEYNNKKDSRIEEYYDNIKVYSENIEEFKQALEKFANTVTDKLNKPVVIFIDELDRSNPKFVIKLIEQLKHIFEIPNLAFILTVNKKELSNTIKGIYGSEMDGYAYYKKFTTHDFTLYPIEKILPDNVKAFIEETMKKYNDFKMSEEFTTIAAKIVQSLNLSLRDIEQVLDHLYYIKEKVTQEYNKEYLIICFFYRAVYIKAYSVFISMQEILEDDPTKLMKRSQYDKSFSDIYDELIELCNQLKNNNPFYGLLANIIHSITENEIKAMVEKYNAAHYLSSKFPDKIEYSSSIEYIGIPMVCKGIDNYNRPVFYHTIDEVKQNIKSIRKNLIQLYILGVKPKEINFRRKDL